jgi:hypothetical protein
MLIHNDADKQLREYLHRFMVAFLTMAADVGFVLGDPIAAIIVKNHVRLSTTEFGNYFGF